MATAQAHRTETKTWEAIFPNEQLTEQKSSLFVKKLLAVAISNITYLRAIFPEHAFGDKCLEDLNLKILRDESSCPGACQVIKWVKGCFDAVDKKYLKTLSIGIYIDPDKPETVIESYTFKFTYHNSGELDIYRNNKKISSAYTAEETKKATIRLLRTLIILTNTLDSLPDNVMMTMKLLYYEDVTPLDYEPPGFKPSSDGAFCFGEEATNIAIGDVSTNFHTVRMRVKTASKQFEMHEEPFGNMEQGTDTIQSISNAGLDKENSQGRPTPVKEIAAEKEPAVSGLKSYERLTTSKSPEQSDSIVSPGKPDVNEDDYSVRCPCGCNEDDGLMIMCSKCKFWQHGVCFLITCEEKAPANHVCDVCAMPGNPVLEPTDPHLSNISSIAVQATCLWRRALTACMEFKRVVAPQLARRLGIENTVAQGLINRLEKEGYLSSSKRGKKLGKTVEKEKIKSYGIPHYLKTPMSLRSNQPSSDNKAVDSLVDKTNKISLHIEQKETGSLNSDVQMEAEACPARRETRGRRGQKRAYSRTDNSEFELASSQEPHNTSAKKKASIVVKDISV